MNLFEVGEKTKVYTALLVCLSVYIFHLTTILKYAVNIPYWDEWEALNTGGIIANPSLEQLFAQHNEHRIVTTKLLTLLLYKIDGWNIVAHQTVNFFIYGLVVFLLAYIVKKCVPHLPLWILLFFTVFLFSAVGWENHFWGFQTQFHFSLLFLFLSIWFLFKENQAWHNIILGTLFACLLIYSLSAGLIESSALLFSFSGYKLIRIKQGKNVRREISQLAVVWVIIGAAIGLYFVGYIKPEHHPVYAFPYHKIFGVYFLNLLSGGFGYKSANILPGSIIFLFTVVPVLGHIYKQRGNLTNSAWIIIASIICILAALSSIVMGRANFGVGHSKASRYAEVVGVLIPLSIAMWMIFLEEKTKLRQYLLIGFWIFCFISFARYWNFPQTYALPAAERLQGAECVRNYYVNGGAADCPTIYPHPIADRLEFNRNSEQSSFKEIRDSINQ